MQETLSADPARVRPETATRVPARRPRRALLVPARAAMRLSRVLYLPTLVIAGVAAWLSWRGWTALGRSGVAQSITTERADLAGPAVLGFVLAVCVIEQLRPAQRRPLLARGHLLDVCYLLFYALLVIPLIVLLGTGFAGLLARLEPWLVLPRVPGVPGWCFLGLAVLGIDAVDWLTHLANHRITTFWRLHAVHHSQEELSILTTYRAHPLVHVSFLLSAVPILAVGSNTQTPAVVFTVYACLGALPHANVRWTYGRAGRVLVSPAYHRIHHSATGRLDINLGTIFAIWDTLSRRAVFPARQPEGSEATVIPTGLAGRPIPVEQAGRRRLGRTMLRQLAEPFIPAAPARTEPQ
jgi:sterol desaturase/sphingolipid hydroxylase (fatty acid hydroxylase superfamily)